MSPKDEQGDAQNETAILKVYSRKQLKIDKLEKQVEQLKHKVLFEDAADLEEKRKMNALVNQTNKMQIQLVEH